MTVAELIAVLQTMPQDLQVVAYDASEAMSVVQATDVEVWNGRAWDDAAGKWVDSPYVEIMPG